MMGLTPRFKRFAIELHHREQIVLVGHRDGRHAELRRALDQLRDAHHAVLQGILGVQPKMDERRRNGRSTWRASLSMNARVEVTAGAIQRLDSRRSSTRSGAAVACRDLAVAYSRRASASPSAAAIRPRASAA